MRVGARPTVLRGGEYDVFRREELRTELAAVELSGDVEIDLRNTTFMDAGAIGLLLALRRRLQARDPVARVHLVNVPPIVRRLLQISGTADAFGVRPK